MRGGVAHLPELSSFFEIKFKNLWVSHTAVGINISAFPFKPVPRQTFIFSLRFCDNFALIIWVQICLKQSEKLVWNEVLSGDRFKGNAEIFNWSFVASRTLTSVSTRFIKKSYKMVRISFSSLSSFLWRIPNSTSTPTILRMSSTKSVFLLMKPMPV